MVSDLADSPYLILSTLVQPSTRRATSSPKSRVSCGERVLGVLDRVVQQGGAQRRLVHAQLGQDRGHGERVGDVRVAALAHLALVHALRGPVGPLDQRQVGLGMVGPDDPEQRVQRRGLRPGRAEPGDPLPHPDPRLLDAGCGAGRILDGRLGLRRDDQGPAGRRRRALVGRGRIRFLLLRPHGRARVRHNPCFSLPRQIAHSRHESTGTPRRPAPHAQPVAGGSACQPGATQGLRPLRSPGGPRPPGRRARAWRRSGRRSAAASCCAPPRSPDRRRRRSATCRPRPW